MTLLIERALLLVRDLDPSGGPLAPDGWQVITHSGGWYEVVRPAGQRVLAYRENDDGVRGLFALFGDIDTLAMIDASSALALPAREVWRRRNEAGVKPHVRRWRTLRGSGQERDAEGNAVPWIGVRSVVPVGAALPDWATDPLPWNLDAAGALTTAQLAVIRVETVDRPALLAEMAGSASPAAFENEPDTGP